MKKSIQWQRWRNPLKGQNERSFVRMTTFGPDAIRLTASDKNSLVWWVGHANFYITAEVIEVIKNTPGVEIFEVFSPYRFRVCVGLNFNKDIVLRSIDRNVCGNNTIANVDDINCADIYKRRVELLCGEDNWLIYVLPNGKFESFSSPDEKEYLNVLTKYDEVQKAVGGSIMTV